MKAERERPWLICAFESGRKETADLSTALRSGRDDKVVTVLELIFHEKKAFEWPQLCHLDRSVAQWRDRRFSLLIVEIEKQIVERLGQRGMG
jgi:hypothetical protein